MTSQTRATLKGYFNTNDQPTEAQFVDLIDSAVNVSEEAALFPLLAGRAGGQTLYGGTGANDDITIHGTSDATRTTSYVLLQPTAGRVGISTTVPLAPLHVGAHTTNNSSDSVVLISRLVDDTIAGNGHAFSDSSYLTRGGTMSYNSFDARIVIGGTENYGHYAAFQTGGIYNSSGTMDHYYAYVSVPSVSAGTVTNMYGAYVAECIALIAPYSSLSALFSPPSTLHPPPSTI